MPRHGRPAARASSTLIQPFKLVCECTSRCPGTRASGRAPLTDLTTWFRNEQGIGNARRESSLLELRLCCCFLRRVSAPGGAGAEVEASGDRCRSTLCLAERPVGSEARRLRRSPPVAGFEPFELTRVTSPSGDVEDDAGKVHPVNLGFAKWFEAIEWIPQPIRDSWTGPARPSGALVRGSLADSLGLQAVDRRVRRRIGRPFRARRPRQP